MPLLKLCTPFCNTFRSTFRFYYKRVDITWKRGKILTELVTDKDKRKNWHMNILSIKPKSRNVLEKVHKPSRRQNVLNALFIRNITDVLSTGDIAPEIYGYGIEITGVKIAPCCRILNVFWQVPSNHNESCEKIGAMLCSAAPRIRAELISRNVLGRVPIICFLRDCTNARIAAFEEALKKVDIDSEIESSVVPDDEFTKDIFSFKKPKDTIPKFEAQILRKESAPSVSKNPENMRCDIFGLNRDLIMSKVITSKSKAKRQDSSVILPENGDLFSNIPSIDLHGDSNRNQLLKQFQIQKKKAKKIPLPDDNDHSDYVDYRVDGGTEDCQPENDYIEEETR